jgi:predicted transcriptional regulator YdeE
MDTQPQPRVVELPAMRLVGLACDCPDFNVEPIGPMWEAFIARRGELVGDEEGLWGASLPLAGGANGFRYLACAVVPAGIAAPEGMEAHDVPAQGYLSLDFFDSMDKLGQAWGELYQTHFPAAGLSTSEPWICLEHYGPDWMASGDGRARLTLYAGVKQS